MKKHTYGALVILTCLVVAGCSNRVWMKNGQPTGQAEFDRDLMHCTEKSVNVFPPSSTMVVTENRKYVNKGRVCGNNPQTFKYECNETVEVVPEKTQLRDANEGARNDYQWSCMRSLGWAKQEVNKDQSSTELSGNSSCLWDRDCPLGQECRPTSSGASECRVPQKRATSDASSKLSQPERTRQTSPDVAAPLPTPIARPIQPEPSVARSAGSPPLSDKAKIAPTIASTTIVKFKPRPPAMELDGNWNELQSGSAAARTYIDVDSIKNEIDIISVREKVIHTHWTYVRYYEIDCWREKLRTVREVSFGHVNKNDITENNDVMPFTEPSKMKATLLTRVCRKE